MVSSTAASVRRLLPIDFALGEKDVLCGRGSACFNHPGNKRFRILVAANLDRYTSAPTRNDKTQIIYEIIDEIRRSSPTGGFVKEDLSTGRYYEVGDILAREKTSQAFRDALHGNLSPSPKSKQCKTKKISSNILRSAPSPPYERLLQKTQKARHRGSNIDSYASDSSEYEVQQTFHSKQVTSSDKSIGKFYDNVHHSLEDTVSNSINSILSPSDNCVSEDAGPNQLKNIVFGLHETQSLAVPADQFREFDNDCISVDDCWPCSFGDGSVEMDLSCFDDISEVDNEAWWGSDELSSNAIDNTQTLINQSIHFAGFESLNDEQHLRLGVDKTHRIHQNESFDGETSQRQLSDQFLDDKTTFSVLLDYTEKSSNFSDMDGASINLEPVAIV